MQFDKTVSGLRLAIEGNDSGLNSQCVVLTRVGNSSLIPYRMTRDELRDLKYLVDRAVETL
jgi:hypothetical protein